MFITYCYNIHSTIQLSNYISLFLYHHIIYAKKIYFCLEYFEDIFQYLINIQIHCKWRVVEYNSSSSFYISETCHFYQSFKWTK